MTPSNNWTSGMWDAYQRHVGTDKAWSEFTALAFPELARLRTIEAKLPYYEAVEAAARDAVDYHEKNFQCSKALSALRAALETI